MCEIVSIKSALLISFAENQYIIFKDCFLFLWTLYFTCKKSCLFTFGGLLRLIQSLNLYRLSWTLGGLGGEGLYKKVGLVATNGHDASNRRGANMFFFIPEDDWKLLLISDRQFVGYLPIGVEVYQITKVGFASLSPDNDVDVSDLNLTVSSDRLCD